MLHEPSKARLVPAEHLLDHFVQLADEAKEMDVGCLDLIVTYIEESDDFVPGTYVPELHLVVRRVDD